MSSFYGTPATPPRLAAFWPMVVVRLATPAMATILGGAGRVYREIGQPFEPEGAENAAWGRVVVVPASTLWEPADGPGREARTAWLVRAEVHGAGDGYDPTIPLEAAHGEAFARLHGWMPGRIETAGHVLQAFGRLPVWRETRPQPLPRWDDERGLWYMSAQYRALIESPDAGE